MKADTQLAEAIFTLAFLPLALAICTGLCIFAFVLNQIIHCATRCPQKDRMIWLIIIFMAPAGSFIYYFIQRPKAAPPILPPKRYAYTYANVPPPQPKKKDPHGFADMDDLFNPPPR